VTAAERTPAAEFLLHPLPWLHAAGSVLPCDQPLERRDVDPRCDEPPRIPSGGRVPVRAESGIGRDAPGDVFPGPGGAAEQGAVLREKRFPLRRLHREREAGNGDRYAVLPV